MSIYLYIYIYTYIYLFIYILLIVSWSAVIGVVGAWRGVLVSQARFLDLRCQKCSCWSSSNFAADCVVSPYLNFGD